MTHFRFAARYMTSGVILSVVLSGCAPSAAVVLTPATVVEASPVYTAPPESSTTAISVGLPIQPSETPFEVTPQPTGTPYTYRAHYQAFERGFMVYAEDATCAYMFVTTPGESGIVIPAVERAEPFGEYHYCTEFAELAVVELSEAAPPGLSLPTDPFARLWSTYPEAREALGYAIKADEWYTVTVYPSAIPVGFSGAPWQSPVIGLPDGRTLMCGFRAATAGQCSR